MPVPEFREDGWLPVGHHRAGWDEIFARFGGRPGSRRAQLTSKLTGLHQALQAAGVQGTILLNGSYISEKSEPRDFDILFIGPANIQVRKDVEPNLAALLDASGAEERGYSLFFIPEDSAARGTLSTLWDFSKEGVAKGVVEITF